jgi:hypothetical protein
MIAYVNGGSFPRKSGLTLISLISLSVLLDYLVVTYKFGFAFGGFICSYSIPFEIIGTAVFGVFLYHLTGRRGASAIASLLLLGVLVLEIAVPTLGITVWRAMFGWM